MTLLRHLTKPSVIAALAVLGFALVASAGFLTPSASPASTMHTLEQIWAPIASSTYDSSTIVANQDGNLIQLLKYIEGNSVWASASGNAYYNLTLGNVGIGDSTPEANFEVSGTASVSSLTIGGSLWGWPLLAPDGTESAPSYAFSGDTDAGMFYVNGTGTLFVSNDTGASEAKATFSGTDAVLYGTNGAQYGLLLVRGSATPFIEHNLSGTPVLRSYQTYVEGLVPFRTLTGSSAAPAYSFTADTNAGMFLQATNDVRVQNSNSGMRGYLFFNTSGGIFPTATALFGVADSGNLLSGINITDIDDGSTSQVQLYVNGTERMRWGQGNEWDVRSAITGIQWEGSIDDAYEMGWGITNPTADRSVWFLDQSGNVLLSTGVSLSGNVETTAYVDSHWRPLLDNTYTLGDSTHRWANLFASNASISNMLEANIASVSQLYIAGSAWGWPLEAPAGTISSPSYAFDGADGMGIFRSTTTMVLQSKDATPDLSGRSRLSLGEEFFNLTAVRSEDAGHSGTLQCYDEGGSSMICRFDVIDAAGSSVTQFLSNRISFGTGASMSGNFDPGADNAYDLGSSANRWRDLYLASGSLHIGTNGDEAVIDYNVNDDYLAFKPDGSTTGFVMTDSGNIGIGTRTPAAIVHVASTGADGQTLLRLEDSNSACDFTANAGSPTCGSDLRLKKNVTELQDGVLEKLTAVDVVTYHWKTDGVADPTMTGFIAQDVQEQFPDLVTTSNWIDGEPALFLSQSGFIPYLVKAIQEQQAMIDALRAGMAAQTLPLLAEDNQTLLDRIVGLFADLLGIEFSPNRIRVEELCLDNVCVTKDELRELLDDAGIGVPAADNDEGGMTNDEVAGDGPEGTVEPSSEPEPSDEPAPSSEPEPEPSEEPGSSSESGPEQEPAEPSQSQEGGGAAGDGTASGE